MILNRQDWGERTYAANTRTGDEERGWSRSCDLCQHKRILEEKTPLLSRGAMGFESQMDMKLSSNSCGITKVDSGWLQLMEFPGPQLPAPCSAVATGGWHERGEPSDEI